MLKKGFTLLEVLIVVIIIGILAAIAMPQYVNTLEKAKSGEAAANIGSIRTSVDRLWYQNGTIQTNLALLDIDDPNGQANRLYNYTIVAGEGANATTRIYTVTATRVGVATTYVAWEQTDNETGRLYRSANLGGPLLP